MRIATSEIYAQQTAAIDNLVAQEAQYGEDLSTGKSVNVPSDDPTQIAQDLAVRTDIGVQTQVESNMTNASNTMTTVDSALASLTNILQTARNLTVQGASDINTPTNRSEAAVQVAQLLQEAVGIANTEYGGTYVFSGTAITNGPPR